MLHFLLSVFLCISFVPLGAQTVPGVKIDITTPRTIIVVFDGLRPDYIRPDWMPRLYDFKRKAAYGKNHHSVFPTVTRVNAASYATGTYPSKNGLMGNNLYLSGVDSKKPLNTGKAEQMMDVMRVTSGKLLTSLSLGEVLKQTGEKMFVYSSGSTGQALLQNHTVNGAIINPDLILPESFREELMTSIGAPPAGENANAARHHWIVEAFCKYTLAPEGPLVSSVWFSDPDGVAHEHGIGVPLAVQALQIVDHEFGRLLDSIQINGLEDQFNIIVTADHGFVTHAGKQGLQEFLVKKKLKESDTSEDVILAGKAIYVKDRNPRRIKEIVEALQQEEWVGAIFTKASQADVRLGWVKGTLSFESVHWNNPQRTADILITPGWNNKTNAYGFAGTDFAMGVAGHGGISPFETHIALLAFGPSFKSALETTFPTSNIDIVPTILHLYGIPIPDKMQGRIMYELLKNNESGLKEEPVKKIITVRKKYKWGEYKVSLEITQYGKYNYINYANTERVFK